MSLNSEFTADPKAFLASTVVAVPEATDKAVAIPKVWQFELVEKSANVVVLNAVGADAQGHIKAYYLPWSPDIATTMVLGAEADFFFTSEMTNCRFSVLDDDDTRPRVAHVAGTIVGSLKKDKAEVESGFADKDSSKRARRLSVSWSRDRNIPGKGKLLKKHDYAGQDVADDRKSSAFVFGVRTGGRWSFHAQIAKGVLTDSYYAVDLTDDVTVLGYVDFANL